MSDALHVGSVVTAVAFAATGLLIFCAGFWVFDRVTPYHLWKEIIEEKNVALAIVVGSVSLGICSIIAAAIHG